jgi:hypothetical protein
MSAPQSGVGHNGNIGAARKAMMIAEITKATAVLQRERLYDKNQSRVNGTLAPYELAALDSTHKIIAMKHHALMTMQVMARVFPKMDVSMGVAIFIDLFSDNPKGRCTYPITKIAAFFSRTPRAIQDCLKKCVACGMVQRYKLPGGAYTHWPTVFPAFLDPAASTHWYVEACLPVGHYAPKMAATGTSLPVLQESDTGTILPGGPEGGFRGDRNDPSDSFPISFPSPSLESGQTGGQAGPTVSPSNPSSPSASVPPPKVAKTGKPRASGRVEWQKLLNPEAAERVEWAKTQVQVTPSGKVTISPEYMTELLQDFTQSEIDAAILILPKYVKPDDHVANVRIVRQACGWIRRDARAPAKPGKTYAFKSAFKTKPRSY